MMMERLENMAFLQIHVDKAVTVVSDLPDN